MKIPDADITVVTARLSLLLFVLFLPPAPLRDLNAVPGWQNGGERHSFLPFFLPPLMQTGARKCGGVGTQEKRQAP